MQKSNNLSFIPKTIIEQLGGMGKLVAIIGTWNFQEHKKPDGISFKFKESRIANYVKITLVSDLYVVKFVLISAKNDLCKEGEKYENVYNLMLKNIFEKYTKLRLSL